MRLFEHPDFEQAILHASEHFRAQGLRPALIEKDYYVTEVLRMIATTVGDTIIVKGGVDLSRGAESHDRWLRPLGPFLLRAAVRRPRRSRGSCARGGRHSERPRADGHR